MLIIQNSLSNSTLSKKLPKSFSKAELLEKIVRNLDYAVIVQDLDDNLIFANDIAAKVCGYNTAKEMVKNKASFISGQFDVFDTDGRKLNINKSLIQGVITTGSTVEKTVRFRSKSNQEPDRHELWSQIKVTPITNSKGQLEQVMFLFKTMRSDEQLERVLEQYQAIVQSSDDAIIGKSLEGDITSWNPGAEKLYGFSAEDMIGRSITTIIPEEKKDEFWEIMEIIKMGEGVDHLETKRLRKDGKEIDVSLTISPIRDNSGKIIGASKIARDISQSKELERRKDDFISMASHELKTPVTTLKAFNQLLLKFHAIDKKGQDYQFLAKMDRQIDNLTELITDLLDLSKIQAGKLDLNKKKFNLDQLIKELISNLQGFTTKHKLILEGKTKTDILGDRDRISQIIINLFSNAIKYSPKANKIVVRVNQENNSVRVSVQDFGIGIDDRYQNKIFDRFFRVEGRNERTFPGLGIGLYISNEIAKRHGGHISLESRKNKGSTFTLQLPVK
jgi:PAS domain S-box-containing protein